MSILSLPRLRSALASVDSGSFAAILFFYPQVTSTNDLLRDLAAQGAPEGTVIVADEQTAGRGRMGRSWVAPFGTSLLQSILFRPVLPPSDAYRLVMMTGLALAEAVELQTSTSIDVKWPNDLQIGGKKLAGILPESAIEGSQLLWVTVGVGLNVNQLFVPSDPLAGTATSLHTILGYEVDRAILFASFMECLNRWRSRLHDPTILHSWRARCVTLGQQVKIVSSVGMVSGLAEQIDSSGALILRTDTGRKYRCTFGEATLQRS